MSGALDAHLWRVDPRALEDESVRARCLALLSPTERARHDRLAAPARRLELAAAHALVRLAVAHVTNTAPDEWRVRRDSVGRPIVEGPVEGMHVSVTHTPGLVACLVARGRDVGVDAEQVSARVPYMRIAEQVFSPGEIEELRRLEDPERIDRFFLLWSVKEALAKARGDGEPLDKIEVPLAASGVAKIGNRWLLRWTRPSPEHVMATCVCGKDGASVEVIEHVGLPP